MYANARNTGTGLALRPPTPHLLKPGRVAGGQERDTPSRKHFLSTPHPDLFPQGEKGPDAEATFENSYQAHASGGGRREKRPGFRVERGRAVYRKILVATDGSETAKRAVRRAGGLARKLGARVTVVTVLHIPVSYLLALGSSIAMGGEPWEALVRSCETVLEEARALLTAQAVTPRLETLRGDPAGEILGLAAAEDYDLIVVGSRGRGQTSAHLLGSVSDRVSHAATGDVLIVR